MQNGRYQGSVLHTPPTKYKLLTDQQEPYKKDDLLTINIADSTWEVGEGGGSKKESWEYGLLGGRKVKRERATGLGRRTEEDILDTECPSWLQHTSYQQDESRLNQSQV